MLCHHDDQHTKKLLKEVGERVDKLDTQLSQQRSQHTSRKLRRDTVAESAVKAVENLEFRLAELQSQWEWIGNEVDGERTLTSVASRSAYNAEIFIPYKTHLSDAHRRWNVVTNEIESRLRGATQTICDRLLGRNWCSNSRERTDHSQCHVKSALRRSSSAGRSRSVSIREDLSTAHDAAPCSSSSRSAANRRPRIRGRKHTLMPEAAEQRSSLSSSSSQQKYQTVIIPEIHPKMQHHFETVDTTRRSLEELESSFRYLSRTSDRQLEAMQKAIMARIKEIHQRVLRIQQQEMVNEQKFVDDIAALIRDFSNRTQAEIQQLRHERLQFEANFNINLQKLSEERQNE